MFYSSATTQTSEHDPELWKARLAEVSDVLLSYSRANRAAVKLIAPEAWSIWMRVGGEMPGAWGIPRRRQEESRAGILIPLWTARLCADQSTRGSQSRAADRSGSGFSTDGSADPEAL